MAFSDDEISQLFEIEARRYSAMVSPVSQAVQSFGSLDGPTDTGTIGVESRVATAGDGFLYDDEPRCGRMTKEVHDHFIEAVTRLAADGFPIRSIARVTGVSRKTIRRWRRNMPTPPCACGASATHQGWCRERFLASERRQQFMREWHPGKQWPYRQRDGFRVAWQGQ